MMRRDEAREALKSTLFGLDEQLRPQDAAVVVADLAYLAPALGSLMGRVSDRLAAAERLPGLYSTANPDARAELQQARAQLLAAQQAVETLTQRLQAAHESLASLGHGDAASTPLAAVDDPVEDDHLANPHPGWRVDPGGPGR